jgi:phage terminase large subunit-like protein
LPSADAPELESFARFCSALVLDSGEAMVLEPFQRRMLADYFAGATETLILLPKKNGKSTLLAALALYHLVTTPDAECVIGAASRDQATILYDQAAGFVRRSDGLLKRVKVKRGYREIQAARENDAGRIRVLAADVDTADGVIPTLALVDELHRHKSAGLYGVFRDGLGPRAGRMLTISTAGDSENSPLGLMRAAARQRELVERTTTYSYVRSVDGLYAMHEWALSREEDTDDLELVKEANPASWQTVEALRVRHDSPSMLSWQWARFACGIWMASEDWWLTADQWRSGQGHGQLALGDQVTLGFDGSRTSDATALVACRGRDGLLVPLYVWEPPISSSEVDAALAQTMERYEVVRAYFDPPLWQSELERWEREYGSVIYSWATNRGLPMSAAVERFRTDLLAGKLTHDGDPRLTAHVMNARTKQHRSGYWLTKEAAADHIDAAVAAVLAWEARADALMGNEFGRRAYRVMSF